MSLAKKFVTEILGNAGITVNGDNPYDIQVHDDAFYTRVARDGRLGLGESYMQGLWDVEELDSMIHQALTYNDHHVLTNTSLNKLKTLGDKLYNMQSKVRSKNVAQRHYDLGNEFYSDMLDPWMQYTCGYFEDTDDLNMAQEQKLDLVCQKLKIQDGDEVLELGCGWGGFAKFAAQHYGAQVTSYNISKEQVAYARKSTKDLPVVIMESDYRDSMEHFEPQYFDKVASIGMAEHVGYKNYQTLMKTAHHALKPGGLFLLHSIMGNVSTTGAKDLFIEKHIFPGGMLPSVAQLSKASEGLFVLEDYHNFGAYYDPTLMAWFENFDKSWEKHKDTFENPKEFYRMWEYYLKSCAGAFRARAIGLGQFVFSKGGVPGGYTSVR